MKRQHDIFRGRTEADDAWSDKDLEDTEAYVASLRSRRFHPTYRNLPEDGDSSHPSEVEKNLHPESEW